MLQAKFVILLYPESLKGYTLVMVLDRMKSFAVVVLYFSVSRLLFLAFSANLGLLCMPHPGMGPLV